MEQRNNKKYELYSRGKFLPSTTVQKERLAPPKGCIPRGEHLTRSLPLYQLL